MSSGKSRRSRFWAEADLAADMYHQRGMQRAKVGLVNLVPPTDSEGVPGFSGQDPHARVIVLATPTRRPPRLTEVTTKEKVAMQSALIYAFVVVAGAPLIGIWRGHVWAKANGLVLRTTATSEQNQTA